MVGNMNHCFQLVDLFCLHVLSAKISCSSSVERIESMCPGSMLSDTNNTLVTFVVSGTSLLAAEEAGTSATGSAIVPISCHKLSPGRSTLLICLGFSQQQRFSDTVHESG